jgi:hypothetical protein
MHSKRIYLNSEIKPLKPAVNTQPQKANQENQENINTLNLTNLATGTKQVHPKQLKIIPESVNKKKSSAKLMPNPKNIFLNLKNNISADCFTSTEKQDTLDFFVKRQCLTFGEADSVKKSRIDSPKVTRFSACKGKGYFNRDTEELELDSSVSGSSSDDSVLNCSFSTTLNITDSVKEDSASLKNPRKLRLQRNKEEDLLSPSKVTHQYLPYNLKDNENYKSRLFRFLRKPGLSDTKTDTHKIKPRKFSELYGKIVFNKLDGNVTKFYSLFNMKRRRINSQKKIFESDHYFLSGMNGYSGPQAFKIYFDRDVGITARWQAQLKETVYKINF